MNKRDKNKHIKWALNALQSQGYFTKRGLADCRTCGWAEIDDARAERAVFTTDQSEEAYEDDGKLYLDWSGNGETIANQLKSSGLEVEWNGDDNRRILVL